ncbi:MAG TPA: 4Fe-4S dicluster domain-containing protein [Syntrophales bacterium]|nr:4Fe-4S dicluster domain-containing protein [Syntrophales bacterium]
MAQKTLVVDLDRCIGCQSCTVSCKQENNVRLGAYWTKILTVGPYGTFPNLETYYLPIMCQYCENPACVKACPTGASYKRSDGIVLIDKNKCNSCQDCILACPYGALTYNNVEEAVEKCTLCAHLVDRGENPACVKACVGKARFFGDLSDPNSIVSKKIALAGNRAFTLRPDAGTKPSVHYILTKRTWRG